MCWCVSDFYFLCPAPLRHVSDPTFFSLRKQFGMHKNIYLEVGRRGVCNAFDLELVTRMMRCLLGRIVRDNANKTMQVRR